MTRQWQFAVAQAARKRPSMLLPWVIIGGFVASVLARDWTLIISVIGLWVIWSVLPREQGPPVMRLALTCQWVQVTAGLWYFALTSRRALTMDECDYQPMVVVGLFSIISLALGLRWGTRRVRQGDPSPTRARQLPLSDGGLVGVVLTTALLAEVVLILADRYYTFNQILLALLPVRTAVVFLLFRRLMRPAPRWGLILLVLGFEVVLGFTSYFAAFKDPLMMLALCLIEVFDYRRESHWVRMAVLAGFMVAASVLWTGIKSDIRSHWNDDFASSRLERLQALGEAVGNWQPRSGSDPWAGTDALVDRMWAIRYPALALSRVPNDVPHTNGALLREVVLHVLQPRILFPDKAGKPSDSLKVREYAGVWVAGDEQDTSIAFGYVAESYVDFGIPLMFIPIFLCGALWGALLQWLRRAIQYEELAIGVTALLGWVNLYQFERSWFMLLGFGLTMVLAVGGLALLVDRVIPLLARQRSVFPGSVSTRFSAG